MKLYTLIILRITKTFYMIFIYVKILLKYAKGIMF